MLSEMLFIVVIRKMEDINAMLEEWVKWVMSVTPQWGSCRSGTIGVRCKVNLRLIHRAYRLSLRSRCPIRLFSQSMFRGV